MHPLISCIREGIFTLLAFVFSFCGCVWLHVVPGAGWAWADSLKAASGLHDPHGKAREGVTPYQSSDLPLKGSHLTPEHNKANWNFDQVWSRVPVGHYLFLSPLNWQNYSDFKYLWLAGKGPLQSIGSLCHHWMVQKTSFLPLTRKICLNIFVRAARDRLQCSWVLLFLWCRSWK